MRLSHSKSSILFLGLVFTLLLSSCIDFKHLSHRGKLLFKTTQQMFRGIHFDMNLQEVKKEEDIKPDIEYKDYLRFQISADSIAAGESIDLEYFFNKNDHLDMMIAFYNLDDKENIHPLADEIRRYLERKYGRPNEDEMGWYHWEFADKGKEPGSVEINLVGESEEGYIGVELELIKYYENEEKVRRR